MIEFEKSQAKEVVAKIHEKWPKGHPPSLPQLATYMQQFDFLEVSRPGPHTVLFIFHDHSYICLEFQGDKVQIESGTAELEIPRILH